MVLALALAGPAAASGCFEPYRVHVDADVVPESWRVEVFGMRGGGLGPKTQETRYVFDPASSSAPFPGTLQVFSIRSPTRVSQADLVALAKDAIEDGAGGHDIVLDGELTEGRRTIDSGVRTTWFLQTGTTSAAGTVFEDEVRIRILGEVGHDGRSNTSFLAVAIVQVERQPACPSAQLGLPCQPERSEATWVQVVGDPSGSVAGATSQDGFIDHLVTR